MNDDDVMAAVFAVLSKPTSLEPAEVEVGNVSQPPSEHIEKAVSRPKAPPHVAKKSRKSKLSTSWGPADIIDEVDTSELSTNVVPAPATETSASPEVSKSHAAAVKIPSQPSLPDTSTSTMTVSVNGRKHSPPSLGRPASSLSAAIPAGSDISEVVVQGQDEGSSDESEDSDSEREMPTKISLQASSMKIPRSRSLSRVMAPSVPSPVELSERDVEALLHGPTSSKSVLSLIPSSSESGSEDEKSESEMLASEEEEEEERAYKRMSRRFARRDTSSDEESTDDEPTTASAGVDKPEEAVDEPVSRTPTCIGSLMC